MEGFIDQLKLKMHLYVKMVYGLAKNFLDYERYGVTSQLRRSSLSVMLNFVEGYARFKKKDKLRFFEIAYGSLKESKYLVYFAFTEDYLNRENYEKCISMAEEVGKMLWKMMEPLRD